MSARILSMLSDFMALWLNVSRALSVVRGLMGLGCVQILFLWIVLDEHGNCLEDGHCRTGIFCSGDMPSCVIRLGKDILD